MARMCLSVLRGKLFISLWPLRSRPQLWWTSLLSISFSSVIFIILTFTDVWLFLLLAYEEISNLKSPLLWAHKPFVLSPYHPISGSENPWDHCRLDNLFSFLDSCFFIVWKLRRFTLYICLLSGVLKVCLFILLNIWSGFHKETFLFFNTSYSLAARKRIGLHFYTLLLKFLFQNNSLKASNQSY